MNPQLPHSLIEHEVICDLCDCPTTEPTKAEIRDIYYMLCPSCYEDNIWQIRDAMYNDMVGADASEADQEEK